MQKEQIERIINQLKEAIAHEMDKGKYDHALGMISACAYLLYYANLYYVDRDLEDCLKLIAQKKLDCGQSLQYDKDTAIFYDGFGLNERGLGQIYLRALCRFKKICYVT